MSIVSINNLTKTYPAFQLDGVSFSLEKGRIAGFIGRNGAGKTTTIKSMLNLVHPDGGEMRKWYVRIRVPVVGRGGSHHSGGSYHSSSSGRSHGGGGHHR